MTESWASTQKQEVSFPTKNEHLQQCRNLPHFFTRIQDITVPLLRTHHTKLLAIRLK